MARKYTKRKVASTKAYVINDHYQITNLIPIPTAYPFAMMKVGDSFSFPQDKRGAVQSSASLYKRKTKGWNYALRGDRIWRTQ